MIPRTYPTTYLTANGKQQMMVYFLGSVDGLERWSDYIPVKASDFAAVKENSYDNDGAILVKDIGSTYGKQAWKDYIPVYVDPLATDAWKVDIDGFIPTFPTPSLSLDFTSSSETLDPRITFSRTTNATRVNSAGVLEYAPHNLLTFSEQFDNAAWSKGNLSITSNTIVAPDGTLTGDKLVENTDNGLHLISRSSPITITANTNHTFSCYIKAAERTKVILRFAKNGTPFTSNNALFDLSAVTATTSSTGFATTNTPTITAVGNGWYRCTMGGVLDASSTDGAFQIRLVDASNNTTYTGDGTSGIYIWGAQLNVGALQPYYPTTVKNLLGFSEAFDNAAWTKSNSFIQTNLLTWSEDITNTGWAVANVTRTADTTVAPNGTNTADTFTVTSNGAATLVSPSGAITAGSTVCASLYVKKSVGTDWVYLAIRAPNFSHEAGVFININTGAIGSSSTLAGTQASYVDSSAVAAPVGNGWYRISAVFNTTVATSVAISLRAARSNGSINNPVAGDAYFIWGAQLVQGSTAGDYQQTFSAALPVMYRDPNGLMTADKLVEDTANSTHFIAQPPAAFVLGTKYTISFYAKAAERTTIDIRGANSATFAGRAVFDLINGTVQSVIFGSASIEPVGNGWYRCVVFGTATASAVTNIQFYLNAGATYLGDGTSGIYIWGAQLSDSASLDTYVNNPGAAPTSTAYYGPRFDYDPVTLAPQGLLVEEQRVNYCLWSEDFTQATWSKSNTTATGNTEVAPNGLTTADTITATADNGTIRQAITTTAVAFTFSVYLKRKTGTGAVAITMDGTTWVDQTITSTGWTRCIVTQTGVAGTSNPGIRLAVNGDEVYAWGAQAE